MASGPAVADTWERRDESLAHGVLSLAARALPEDSGIELALAGDAQRHDALARVVFVSTAALGRALWPPTPDGLGDAYLRGDFDIEGDIAAVARAGKSFDLGRLGLTDGAALLSAALRLRSGDAPARPLTHRVHLAGPRHSITRDREAVQFHYDVGNSFYALWLDQRMTYSCAHFASPAVELDAAQEAKLDLVCRKLALRPGQRLLDIGCGWGSLIVYAAERYGVEATGVTLSEEQARVAADRAREHRVAGHVRALVLDYRQLDDLGSFDAVASIGMFEHVGRAMLPTYFAAAHRSLRPGGFFLNHGIAVPAPPARHRPTLHLGAGFISTRIFPDGELVTVTDAVTQAERAGFELVHAESLRPHYALTLAHWVRRLEAAREQACSLVSEEVYRAWHLYLAGSRVGFERGELDVSQLLLQRRPTDGSVPRPLQPWW